MIPYIPLVYTPSIIFSRCHHSFMSVLLYSLARILGQAPALLMCFILSFSFIVGWKSNHYELFRVRQVVAMRGMDLLKRGTPRERASTKVHQIIKGRDLRVRERYREKKKEKRKRTKCSKARQRQSMRNRVSLPGANPAAAAVSPTSRSPSRDGRETRHDTRAESSPRPRPAAAAANSSAPRPSHHLLRTC